MSDDGARRVLITAGAAGIGRAMAEAFAGAGWRVWVTDVDEAALAATPARWHATPCDVTDAEGMDGIFELIEADWGGLDCVCANAGIAGPTALVEDVTLEAWRQCLAVNLEGAFLVAKHAAPMMKRAGSGSMIFTSSNAGFNGFPHRSPYSAAKWGVVGLMKTLAMELGPYGVRANAIAPGPVEGPRIQGVLARKAAAQGVDVERMHELYAGASSLRRFVRPAEVAAMAVFLASDAAAMVSGQLIAVDGHTENADPRL